MPNNIENTTLANFNSAVTEQYNSVNQTIILDNNINTAIPILLKYVKLAALTLTNATLESQAEKIIIKGKSELWNIPQNIQLTAIAPNNTLQLILTAEQEDILDLRIMLPNLANSRQANRGLMESTESIFYALTFRDAEWLITDMEPAEGIPYPSLGLNLRVTANINEQFPLLAKITGQTELEFRGPVLYNVNNTLETDVDSQVDAADRQLFLEAALPMLTIHTGPLELNQVHYSIRTTYYEEDNSQNLSHSLLAGTIEIDNIQPIQVGVDIQQGSNVWTFFSEVEDPLTLNNGLTALAEFVGGNPANFVLPDSVRILNDFGLSQFYVGINPQNLADVSHVFIEVKSNKIWNPPIPYLTIRDLFLQWQIMDPFGEPDQRGGLGGTLTFGTDNPVDLDLIAIIPEFILQASLREGEHISFIETLQAFYPDAEGFGQDLWIDELMIRANLTEQTYELQAGFKPEPALVLPLLVTDLIFKHVTFYMNYGQNSLYATLIADLEFLSANWSVSAAFETPNFWTFTIRLYEGEQIALMDILADALDFHSQYVPAVDITKLFLSYNLPNYTYKFVGEVSTYWNVDIFPDGGPYILAGTSIEKFISSYDGVTGISGYDYRGSIYGSFAINDFLTKVKYSFAPNTDTIEFSIRFRKLELIADLLRRNIGEDNEEVLLEIGLGDLTFGEVVEYLVNLADPEAEYALTAPWTILNQINFKDIKLLVNLTTKAVGVVYHLNRDFVFARIDTLSLTYSEVRGKGVVKFEYTGRLLDQTYDINNPVGWDLLDDPAPAVPSSELALFKIKYLGIGQHVAMDNVQQFNHVIEVMDALKASMQPVEDSEQNPLTQQTGLSFNENSKWLFGLDIELIRMLSLSLVFNDPQLYGVSLGLSGERAGALAGLQFEVLYIKVTDDIGVFKIELRVPDAFRQLDFGQVSVTLPVLKLEIFTNGNFKVDLGFPVNGDFTDSFCLQVFPYIGYGGFYFASLNGATSDRVPTISNGTFSPVIEAGLGLSIGLGKTFNKGVLKAGLTLTVEGILEGCLAWFNPDDTAAPDPMYYWLQGTVALVGKLFGYVDFKVIKVDVSVTARLSTTLTIEAYEPIEIEFKVSVEIEASAKVAFITVNFSFEEELSASFLIGAPRRTPWRLGERDNGDADAIAAAKRTPRLRMQRPHRRRFGRRKLSKLLSERQSKRLRASAAPQAKVATTPTLYFSSDRVFNTVQTVSLSLLPNPTIADPTTLQHNNAGNTAIEYQINMLLFAENTIPVEATTAAAAQTVSGDDPTNTPFNLLVQGMLSYALNAYLGASENMVNELQLEVLHELLDTNTAENTGFAYANLKAFLQNNYEFIIHNLPSNNNASTSANATSATIFPMIPEFIMSVAGIDEVAFDDKNKVSADYEAQIAAYFDQLAVDYTSQVADRPFISNPLSSESENNDQESMATMIFRDYFWMMAKAAVQESINLLQEFPYPVQNNQSLYGIANAPEFPRVTFDYSAKKGDTIASVAAHYSLDASALGAENGMMENAALTPGQTLQIQYGVTVADIALSNSDQPLQTGIQLDIRSIHYQVANGDSLNSIADRFHLEHRNPAFHILSANEQRSDIFANGQIITIADIHDGEIKDYFSYLATAEDKEQYFLAAFFTCRTSLAGLNQSQFSWYRQTIIDLNPTIDFSRIFAEVDAATGSNRLSISLNIPSSYQNDDENTARTYTIRPYDSLALIAGYFTLQQNPTQDIIDFARAIGPIGVGGVYKIPAIAYTLQSTDTHPAVFEQFTSYYSLVTKANGSTTNLLNPLAVLEIPTITHITTEGETLASIAAYYNITIEELAVAIQNKVDIFPTDTVLTIKNVPQLSIAALQENIIHNGHSNKIAAMVSRFLLYGLRLPWDTSGNIFNSNTPLYSIYDLTGQQFSTAEFPPNEPISIEFRSNLQTNNWLNFANSYIIQENDTVSSLNRDFLNIEGLNPQINWVDPLPFGAIIYTQIARADNINLFTRLDTDYQKQYFPSTTFAPDFTPPRALPLYEEHPRRYDLATYAHWQTSEHLTLPNPTNSTTPATGEPSIWFFPKALVNRVGHGKFKDQPFHLHRFMEDVTDDNYPTVDRYAWATFISFKIRLVVDPNQSDQYLSNTYEIAGASHINMERLEALWIHAQRNATAMPTIHLLYPPNATAANSAGLLSDPVLEDATFLLKTNLSTNDDGSATPAAAGDYHATITDAVPFLKYLWEALVVQEGGYHLHYVQEQSGAGIPVTTFDESRLAEVSLLVTLAPQTATNNPDRNLLNFVNCAVVGDNIDAGLSDLFAAAADNMDKVRIATVPAGNIGFEVTGNLPTNTNYLDETATEKTLSLYSLLGYHLVENNHFNGSMEGLPIGPTKNTETNGYYHQLVPIASFAKTSATPSCPALPATQTDPYAGIYHNNQGLGKATFAFDFHDLFGNRLGSENGAPFADLDVPVGYYDELIGVGQWPSITSSYLVRPFSDDDLQPVLDLYLEFQINNYLPSKGMSYAQAMRNTSAHLMRYQQIWYQLQQTDVDVRFISTLGVDHTSSHKRYFANYVNAIYTFLTATQGLNTYQHSIAANDNLADICNTYATNYQNLADVNEQIPSTDLFSGAVQIPYYLTVIRNETVDSIVTTASGISDTSFDLSALLANNPSAKLTTNIVVAVTPYYIFVNSELDDVANNSLSKIARQNNATVGGLGVLNAQVGAIAGGIELYVGIYEYTTIANDSLYNITYQFNRLAQRDDPSIPDHFTVADIAVAVQNVKGLISQNASLQLDEYVTQTGDTLHTLSAINGEQSENWALPNLIQAGESLYLFKQQPAGFVDDRLEHIADTYGLTVAELLAANADTELKVGSTLTIPGQTTLAATEIDHLYAPYFTRSDESLQTIADHFNLEVNQLTTDNQYIPYFFPSQKQITVNAATVTTHSKDSLQRIIERFMEEHNMVVSLTELTEAIKDDDDLLMSNNYLACPLPQTQDDTDISLHDLAHQFHLAEENIAEANAGLVGFLRVGGEVDVQGNHLTIGAQDTLNTLVNRYQQQFQIEITVSELAIQNKNAAIIAANARFLLPPKNRDLLISLQNYADGTPSFTETLFKLSLKIEILRDKNNVGLVHPDFTEQPEVRYRRSTVPPRADYTPDGQLSLVGFAASFEETFNHQVKVAVAKTDEVVEPNTDSHHIWILNFTSPETQVVIQADEPRYYALRPLSNQLISQRVPLRTYENGLLSDTTTEQAFKSVDLEVWASDYLQAIDLFLSAPYAVPAFQISSAAYERIVRAKERLTELISDGLESIVGDAASAEKLAAAKNLFKNQLREELSPAYTMDAILQYDVEVTADFSNQSIAPRFAGKLVNAVYQTAAVSNLDTIAAANHVSPLYVADTLRYHPTILNVGLTVSYPAQTDHTIESGDTLQTLLEVFSIENMEELVDGLYWDNQTTQGLFLGNTTLNLTDVNKAVGQMNLEELALYFDQNLAAVAVANQETTGFFLENTNVPYGEQAVLVTSENNTLAAVATAFNDPAVTPTALAEANRLNRNILNPDFVMYVLKVMPDFSTATSKLSLATGTNTLNFMLDVKALEEHRHLLLKPDFYINQLEYNIADAETATGYQASHWLSFVLPITPADQNMLDVHLGQPEIPLPLRTYPAAPTILSQSSTATYRDTAIYDGTTNSNDFTEKIDQAKKWDFVFDYLHTEAEQDTGYLEAFFAVNPHSFASAEQEIIANNTNEFVQQLAQFSETYPKLQADLNGLLTETDDATLIQNAVTTFADLVEAVATTWTYLSSADTSYAPATALDNYPYEVRFSIRWIEGQPYYQNLILKAVDQISPSGAFPTIAWIDTTGYANRAHELRAEPQGDECIYHYQEEVLAFQPIQHQIRFSNLNIMTYRNAISGAAVRRNLDLIESPTRPDFIFQSPEVLFNKLHFAQIIHNEALPIFGANISAALTSLFNELLIGWVSQGNTPPLVKIAIQHGFVLAQDPATNEEIVSQRPIAFRPVMEYSSAIPQQIDDLLVHWLDDNPAASTANQARFIFQITLLEETEHGSVHPFLTLKNVRYDLG